MFLHVEFVWGCMVDRPQANGGQGQSKKWAETGICFLVYLLFLVLNPFSDTFSPKHQTVGREPFLLVNQVQRRPFEIRSKPATMSQIFYKLGRELDCISLEFRARKEYWVRREKADHSFLQLLGPSSQPRITSGDSFVSMGHSPAV